MTDEKSSESLSTSGDAESAAKVVKDAYDRIRGEVHKVIVGQEEVLETDRPGDVLWRTRSGGGSTGSCEDASDFDARQDAESRFLSCSVHAGPDAFGP